MPIEKVLVVGGGLAGMTLATALARKGVRAEIVEISQQWSALGVGISVQGPTLRALKTVGALDACVERGSAIPRSSPATRPARSPAGSNCRS
jgi:2-polyprenyl-6-methoxyphenol hydroxylase-like FAD-dependent oxidoreductase